MTFAELHFFIEGFEYREREEWKRTRMTTWGALAPHQKRGFTPKKVFKIKGEMDQLPKVDKDQYLSTLKRIGERHLTPEDLN